MAKPKVSLADMMAHEVAATPIATSTENAAALSRESVTTLQRDDVKTSKRIQHTSLYLPPEVRKAIKEIAFQYDRRPHDLYMEGIDLMLTKYGKPTSGELSKK